MLTLLALPELACGGDRPATDGADGDAGGTLGTESGDDGSGSDESGDATADGTGDGDGDGDPGDGDGDGDDGLVVAFGPGALIIPMDTDFQDMGMLEAYGLLYQLLLAKVPVSWAIAPGKELGDVDFTTSAVDLRSGAEVLDHGYRGGPFVVHPDDVALALPVVQDWLDANPNTNVHEASAPFEVFVARYLLQAPTIAIFADGNEDIARGYLLAAKIPDSTGDLSWPDDSPDLLDVDEVAGPSDVDHQDGALFGGKEAPIYCQFMSMHWGINEALNNPEVVAEVGQYLRFSTHFFAECQAVNAFENHPEFGHFLTPNGLEIADRPTTYDFYRMDTPFGQHDGSFESVGGSEPAYTLPAGDSYLESDTTIISEAGTAEGVADVWMTGFRNGQCPASAKVCPGAGKISYLGGHAYDTKLPISQNPTTVGVRLFLNSLFEAPCTFK
ncbi:hypothetical protein [Enhygromyxa salina]|uniref:hypothetical protein n=1 Tax=Enhygromyxa salina TaxID=215803 RepID=UPI000D03DCA1|nr:hypothetical protein [Enhygromyxa salina]